VCLEQVFQFIKHRFSPRFQGQKIQTNAHLCRLGNQRSVSDAFLLVSVGLMVGNPAAVQAW
jgi:hypothetical protein